MTEPKIKPKFWSLTVSLTISAVILIFAIYLTDDLSSQKVISSLLWPLLRLMLFICAGLVIGQIVEDLGWTKNLAALARPFFKFSNLGNRCSAAFTTAFFSGIAANAMLMNFYKEGKICRNQLFLTNFVNQFPAYFLHLPTTIFIILPLTGMAGVFYFIITFAATLFRTALFLIYGRIRLSVQRCDLKKEEKEVPAHHNKRPKEIVKNIKKKLPGRIINIAVYVMPVYALVFILNEMGVFNLSREWLAGYFIITFMPVEALSVVILSFAAEFTSGFAAAGALLDAGVLTTKQGVLALLIGNIIAFPIRALRHQLPGYIGIFSPKMGTQLLIMGQGFRVASLIIMGIIYYYLG